MDPDVDSPRSEPVTLAQLLRWGLPIAFGAGLVEVLFQAFRRLVLDKVIWQGPDLLWMSPLAYIGFFLVGIVGLWILGRGLAFFRRADVVLFCFWFVGFAGVLLVFPLHPGAVAVLAAGLATQVTKRISPRPAAFDRKLQGVFGRFGLPVPVGVFAATAVLFLVLQSWISVGVARGRAQLVAQPEGTPNVLVVILDTVRAKSLGLFDGPENSPQLESFARSATHFSRAMSTSSWTLPGHASAFTGHWPSTLAASWNDPLDDRYLTLAEALSEEGYETRGFVANTFYGGYEHGLNRGFLRWEDFRRSPGQIFVSSSFGRALGCWNRWGAGCRLRDPLEYYELLGRKKAAHVNGDFFGWLDRRPDGPFFAFLNYIDAHGPYLPSEDYDVFRDHSVRRENPMHLGAEDWEISEAQLGAELGAYEGAIFELDAYLGELFGELERRGLRENTLIVVTSDHGEEFRDNDEVMFHGNSLHYASIHVPLLVSFPGRVPADVEVEQTVSLRDLPATVFDLLGRPNPGFPGESWMRYVREPSLPSTGVIAELAQADWRNPLYPVTHGDLISVVTDDLQYVLRSDGEERVFDVSDRHRAVPLPPPEAAPLVDDLRSLMCTLQPDPGPLFTTGCSSAPRDP